MTPPRLARSVRAVAVIAAAALLGSGCHASRPGITGDRARIVFENESIAEATLFATMPGHGRYRVGSVMPNRTDTLVAPLPITGRTGVSFFAVLLGLSAQPVSTSVSVMPRDWVWIRLPASLTSLDILPGM